MRVVAPTFDTTRRKKCAVVVSSCHYLRYARGQCRKGRWGALARVTSDAKLAVNALSPTLDATR